MKTNLTFLPFRHTTVWRSKFLLAALAAALGASSFPLASSAQTITSSVPGLISFQGRVTLPGGGLIAPTTPENRLVTLRIWSSAQGSLPADLIYSEQQIATISQSEFSVLLGQGSEVVGETTKGPGTVALGSLGVFSGPTRYLGITVDDGTAAADFEISPRQQIVTSAYAFRAKYAESLGTSGTSALTVVDGGNVGVGFPNPGFKLEVNGNVSAAGSIAATGAGGFTFRTGDADGGIFSPADDTVVIKTNSTNRVTVTSTGLTLNTGTMFASGYSFTAPGDTDGGIFSAADGVVAFRTNATEKMRLDPSGQLGLGTASPAYTLDVRSATPEMFVGTPGGTLGALYLGGSAHGVKRNYNAVGNDVGLYTSQGDLYLSANGATRTTDFLLKNSTGNVAIGAATVTDRLNVGGNVRVTGSAPSFVLADAANVTRGILGLATSAANFSTDAAVGDTVLRSEAGKILLQSGTAAAAIMIGSDNAVTVKSSLLALQGFRTTAGVATHGQGAYLEWNKDNALGKTYLLNQKGGGTGGIVLGEVDTGNGITTRMEIQSSGHTRFDGRVGIFQSDPQANLHVTGSANSTFNRQAYLDADNATATPFNASTTQAFSIISDARVRADGFEVNSDLRLKNVVRLSDGREDLVKLLAIRITDYTFKDLIEQSAQPQKKVIAQQVEEVFPQAVGRSTNVVPDIFQKADLRDGWVQLATDLKVGERVRLITGEKSAVHTVLAVEATRFRTDLTALTDRIFVYGREVKDFRSVDYDAIAMLNVSATQQLKRDTDSELHSLRAENAALRSQLADQSRELAAQARRFAAAETQNTARDAKLAAIEKLLSAPGTVMARPAKLSTASGQ